MTNKNLIAYALVASISLSIGGWVIWKGNQLTPPPSLNFEKIDNPIETLGSPPKSNHQNEVGSLPTPSLEDNSIYQEFSRTIHLNASNSIAKTLTQIVIIMILARIMGVFFRKLGQPTVIGEILAGILLGPTFFGWVFPNAHAFLFSAEQINVLENLSQLGLILFMFVIGMDIDLSYLRKKAESAILVSHTSIFFPFLLGLILAYIIYEKFAPSGVRFLEFSLFIGITMSVTAFPLLARILHERGLSKTSLGTMAITCAAFDDLTAWALLAMIIALVQSGSAIGIIVTLILTVVYLLIMFFLVHPFLRRLSEIYVSRENLTKTAMAIVFVYLFSSSLLTELIGIHALIGAFFAGVIMPSDQKLKDLISERIDYIALVFLLPLFFAYTGMKTDLWTLAHPGVFGVLCLVIGFAVVGKFVGSSIAARFVGMSWKDSLSLGTLMNTRGLMELIVLNIGFQLGVLTPPLFSSLVVMTLLTTFLTGPTLQWIQNFEPKKIKTPQPLEAFKRILISFAQPSMGVALIKLADFLFGVNKDKAQITTIHITPTEFLSPEEETEYKRKSFADIELLVNDLNFSIEMIHRTTENITYEILNQAKKSNSRFLLIGAAKSLFTKNILGGRIRSILSYAPCNVGVLLDNGLDKIKKVLVLKKSTSSLGYEKMIHYLIREHSSKKIKFHTVAMFTTLKHEDFSGYQLVIIELDLWKEREEFLEVEIQTLDASFLIVQFK
jgi:Kef-type K+ transport system membrane component KefB